MGIIMTRMTAIHAIVKTVNCNYLFTDRATTFNSRGNEGCHHLFNRQSTKSDVLVHTRLAEPKACWFDFQEFEDT